MELRGRKALLTGAAGGLGGYIARALAAEGVDLALCDLPSAEIDPLVEELRGRGITVESVPADLTETAALEVLADRAEEAIGPVDILVNNAGLEFAGAFEGQTRAELEAITTVNLLAVMELTRVFLPRMLERGRGHIVNVASLAGKFPSPMLASYSATKHGVVGFTHALRAEHQASPVGFTAICPTFVSRVGMYGRVEDLVEDPPRGLKAVPPEAVGEAVVKGVREDRAEVIVNSMPSKVAVAIAAAAPSTFTKAIGSERVMRYGREFARARGRA
jgi:short-subunit dehydrogenase